MSGNNGIIIKTTNGGMNWVTLNTNGITDQLWGLEFVNSLTGFVCGSSGRIMKTTDAGTSWFNQTAGLTNALSNMHFRNESTGYISGSSIILKTTNGGANWQSLSAPYISFETIRDIHFTTDNDGIAVSDAGRMFKSTNAGANWALIPSGTGESLFGIYFTDPNTAIACGNNGAIIRTTSGGANWQTQVSPLTEILTDVWFTTANTGYISTWSGKILKTTNGGVTFINHLGTEIPHEFSLMQNYPNPFNPVSRIRFSIPSVSGRHSFDTKLIIYNSLGIEITELVNQSLQPGTYEVDWNASSHPSGVYFYQLKTQDFSQTKKMILVK